MYIINPFFCGGSIYIIVKMYMPDNYIYCMFIEYTVSLLVSAVSNKPFMLLTCVVIFVMLINIAVKVKYIVSLVFFFVLLWPAMRMCVREVILTHSL